jgi:tRNA1(Val) A37 N6-methylase TrmN6
MFLGYVPKVEIIPQRFLLHSRDELLKISRKMENEGFEFTEVCRIIQNKFKESNKLLLRVKSDELNETIDFVFTDELIEQQSTKLHLYLVSNLNWLVIQIRKN